ncbi:MAG: ferrochelatase [Candidatus Sericytochromatia bacterium]
MSQVNSLEIEKKSDIKKGKQGILLINLGTPDNCTTSDIRKYLAEFLWDYRVIDINTIGRFLLLNLIILPTRPQKILPSYKQIWLKEGSPLLVYSKNVLKLMKEKLSDDYYVDLGMRYGNPSINAALERMKAEGVSSIKVIPLYPQYASASNASTIEKVMEELKTWQNIPSVNFISYFYDNPKFIQAFADIGKKYLEKETYDHILFSFHGIPERQISKGDNFNSCNFSSCCEKITSKNQFCYRAQCFQTAYLIAEKLGLSKDKFSISFQSRLGKTPWIKPYTDVFLEDFAKKGGKKILVFAPSFVSDCLETVYEIGHEYNELVKKFGGEKVQLVESLNDHPLWIEALEDIILNSKY